MTDHTTDQPSQEIPYGYCRCGCGQKTPIAKRNQDGNKKGEPIRFIRGHNGYRPMLERFLEKVDKSDPNGCWIWTACRDVHGYGQFYTTNHKHAYAHRVSYEIHVGPIPDGMCACHNCPNGDNPSCVNPAHLFIAPQIINVRDMIAKGRDNRAGALRGEEASGARLTSEQVRDIREKYATGALQESLAKIYGVKQATVSLIIRRKTWAHIK